MGQFSKSWKNSNSAANTVQMKRRELLWSLQRCRVIEDPKTALEQYSTSAEIATEILLAVACDIEDKVVIDLGCGGGIFACGAALMGAAYCIGIDLDEEMIQLSKESIEELEVGDKIELLQCDVTNLKFNTSLEMADVVITNPPFGTKHNEGMDMKFVEIGLSLAPIVYSLHKTSTRKFILKQESKLNADIEVIANLKWELLKTHKFHKQKSVDILVDLVKYTRK